MLLGLLKNLHVRIAEENIVSEVSDFPDRHGTHYLADIVHSQGPFINQYSRRRSTNICPTGELQKTMLYQESHTILRTLDKYWWGEKWILLVLSG
ncbi:hypothetical protein AVEN_247063-1 [Araneus ventricosus]|nr:hypothetical protein AVEN_247063-1 [Araneus ventricosus]